MSRHTHASLVRACRDAVAHPFGSPSVEVRLSDQSCYITRCTTWLSTVQPVYLLLGVVPQLLEQVRLLHIEIPVFFSG